MDSTSQNQSGPGSNGKEEVTLHSQELQKWSLSTRCSLVSYQGHPFLGRERSYGLLSKKKCGFPLVELKK